MLSPAIRRIAIGTLRQFESARKKLIQIGSTGSDCSPPARALEWVRANELPTGGIRVHSNASISYPEVTGYLIPTLLKYGERDLAVRLAHWLLSIQRSDGGFAGPDGLPYVFDSGQVLRGLLAVHQIVPEALPAARRLADYLCAEMIDEGKRGFRQKYSESDTYKNLIPETIQLYVLPALVQSAEILQESKYRTAAKHCLDYYCAHEEFLRIDDLTHFLGYQLEALIDLDRPELALPVLDLVRKEQSAAGAVRGKGGESWVCTPGLAQLAICWYKTEQPEPADKAMAWLDSQQCESGGFWGSYGNGAGYLPTKEPSWAAKFYLDAHLLRLQSFFDQDKATLHSDVALDDGRTQAILSLVRPGDKVAEVGCGKGRFLKAVKSVYPDVDCTGIDISPVVLSQVPKQIETILGPLEAIPVADNTYDVAFSIEAIEHSANPYAAVKELCRVVKPNGWVSIIDKQLSHWGRLKCPSWERWPDAASLGNLFCEWCDNVTVENVAYNTSGTADGLMVVWRGRKKAELPK
jgi:malonyl-CoA O-methyltransferase